VAAADEEGEEEEKEEEAGAETGEECRCCRGIAVRHSCRFPQWPSAIAFSDLDPPWPSPLPRCAAADGLSPKTGARFVVAFGLPTSAGKEPACCWDIAAIS
jgi:hypothetical protein